MRPLLPRPATQRRRESRRAGARPLGRATGLAALLAAGTMVLAACTSGSQPTVTVTTTANGTQQVTAPSLTDGPATDTTSPSDDTQPATTTASSATDAIRVSADPGFGSKTASPNDPVTVTAFHADLKNITMTGDDGSTIDGEIGDSNRSWSSTGKLKYGVTYTISGEAVGTDGTTKHIDGRITTVKPAKTMAAYIQIPDGATVGIAAPIVVTFAGPVTNRAAAEKELHVTINDGQEIEGSWGWMQDEDIQGNGIKQSRVHFRPKAFWPANAKVHVEADLYGVNYGSGWGRENIVRDFKIGPKLEVKADVNSFRLLVVKDDKVIKNYPVSYGKESIPGRNTVSGIHIVQDKNTDNPDGSFKMCNLAYGYCNVTEYWGVRINNNGEFIHVNKQTEAAGLLGRANVSHGCVNMSMADGKEFYDMVYYGVPVEVTGTSVKMSEKDYVWDWSKTWEQWKALSAL